MAQGMSYNEARARVMRIVREPNRGNVQLKQNLVRSIINQAAIREGQGAAREIIREASSR